MSVLTTIRDEGAERKLARLRGKFAHYEQVLDGPVKMLIRDFIQRQFDTEGRAGGGPGWPEIIRKYRPAEYMGKPILQQTGHGMESLTVIGHPDQEIDIRPEGITYKSLVGYMGVHQEGWGPIPRREIIPDEMPPEFMARLKNIIRGYFVDVEIG